MPLRSGFQYSSTMPRRGSRSSACPGLHLGEAIDRLTPWAKRLVAGRVNINRAGMLDAAEIKRHMGLDISDLIASAGAATVADLKTLGWTAVQLDRHGEAAKTRAQELAVRSARTTPAFV